MASRANSVDCRRRAKVGVFTTSWPIFGSPRGDDMMAVTVINAPQPPQLLWMGRGNELADFIPASPLNLEGQLAGFGATKLLCCRVSGRDLKYWVQKDSDLKAHTTNP